MTHDDNERYERPGRRRMPRWAVVTLVVLVLIGMIMITMLLIGGPGGHGPARHVGLAATR